MTRVGAFLWILAAVLLTSYIVSLQAGRNLNIDSNILKLLPETQSDPAVSSAFDNFSDINMRRLVFLVENTDLPSAKNAAQQLASSLNDSPWLDELVVQVSPQEQQDIAQFNFDYRHHLLTRSDEALLLNEQYDAFAGDAIERIYSPLTGGLAMLLTTDPFLLSYRFAAATAMDDSRTVNLNENYLIGEADGNYYVLVTGTLTQSPFDQALQEDVLARIESVENQWRQEQAGTQLIRTGALFYTADAYEVARGEVSLFGGASLLLVISLILLAFRSLTPVLLVSLSLSFGIGCGFAVVRLVFGEVHLLTFIFGSSLIGVAVDYAFHYFSVRVEHGNVRSSVGRLQAIFPAITLGLMSSVIGYTALATTPFPGLQQMAIFCMVGLAGAYATVVLLFPVMPIAVTGGAGILRLCQRFIVLGGSRVARLAWAIALALPLLAAVLLATGETPTDDIREFQARNLTLESQEAQIQSVLKSPAANQFYLVRGNTQQQLLQELELAASELDVLIGNGVIENYISVSSWLPSQQMQQENYQLYGQLYDSEEAEALIDAGLLSNQEYSSAASSFEMNEVNYLTPDIWLQSVLGRQMAYLWLGQIDNAYFSVIALRGITDFSQLRDINSNIVFIDQVSTISELLVSYRESAGLLLLIAVALIFAVLSFRYGFRRAAIVVSSPIIAMSATVVVLAVMGESINLFNVLALFLVIGIGIDFGIFFAEAEKPKADTLLAILLSALTTTFSFGMLSMSSTTVIQSFGLSMLIGIATVFMLAPVIGNLVVNKGELP